MPKYKIKKTTCDEKLVLPVLQPPTAEAVALLAGVSTNYVKKITSGIRPANTEKAKKVMYCHETIVDAQAELVKIVAKSLDKIEL